VTKRSHVEQTRQQRREELAYQRSIREKPRCTGCGGSWVDRPGPMLHNYLWTKIARKTDVLCEPCILRLLKRPVTIRDLRLCPFNERWFEVLGYDNWFEHYKVKLARSAS
jgi:hypothetical protein